MFKRTTAGQEKIYFTCKKKIARFESCVVVLYVEDDVREVFNKTWVISLASHKERKKYIYSPSQNFKQLHKAAYRGTFDRRSKATLLLADTFGTSLCVQSSKSP